MKQRDVLRPSAPNTRSRISNRKSLLPGLDGRSSEQRRFRDLVSCYTTELHHDPTEGELALIKITASATVAIEILQSRIIAGKASAAELSELPRLGNLITRNLIVLGLTKSKAPEHQPETLADYLASRDEVAQ